MAGRQGFASMAKDLGLKISSKGGAAVHAKGTAYKIKSTEEARRIGKISAARRKMRAENPPHCIKCRKPMCGNRWHKFECRTSDCPENHYYERNINP